MTEKDLKKLMALAKELLQQDVSPKEALASLVKAGILTEKGNYTSPYKQLASADQ